MKSIEQKASRSHIPMWGVQSQRCCHGNAMVASTTTNSSPIETLCGELIQKVAELDTDKAMQFDCRMLGVLEPNELLKKSRIAVNAHPELSLPSNPDYKDIIEKADLFKSLVSGRRVRTNEELSGIIKSICAEAGQHVCEQFDSAIEKIPSKMALIANDLITAIDRMGQGNGENSHGLLNLEKRSEQFKTLPALAGEMKKTTYQKLKMHLLQKAQTEYSQTLKEWAGNHFWQYWKVERNKILERCEKFKTDSQTFVAKLKYCVDEYRESYQRNKDRLLNLTAGNQVILQEASEDQLLTALMANRRVGSPSELVANLRYEYEEKLRQCAEQRGLGQQQARSISFRSLIIAIPVANLVDLFRALILDNISNGHSFYSICQSYGLDKLVAELVKRSRITSWFDGRDDQRFGITRFEVRMVRLPKATNPKDAEIRELLTSYFQMEGFNDILESNGTRNISVLRIYAGWPLGIEGGNQVLLGAYKQSVQTTHLPHLVGILPDSEAGRHASSLMKL